MAVTALYAGLLAPIFLILSFRVIAVRRGAKIALGDAGDPVLLRRMRAHANFAEYVPFCLVLIGLAESTGAPLVVLHGLGIVLLAGRLSHAIGVSRHPETFAWRVGGMIVTFSVIGVAAIFCLLQ